MASEMNTSRRVGKKRFLVEVRILQGNARTRTSHPMKTAYEVPRQTSPTLIRESVQKLKDGNICCPTSNFFGILTGPCLTYGLSYGKQDEVLKIVHDVL